MFLVLSPPVYLILTVIAAIGLLVALFGVGLVIKGTLAAVAFYLIYYAALGLYEEFIGDDSEFEAFLAETGWDSAKPESYWSQPSVRLAVIAVALLVLVFVIGLIEVLKAAAAIVAIVLIYYATIDLLERFGILTYDEDEDGTNDDPADFDQFDRGVSH